MKLIKCEYCNKEYSTKGISTHIMRTHLKVGFNGSTGKNNSYDKKEYKQKLKDKREIILAKRLGHITSYDVNCHTCGISFSIKERANKYPSKDKYFCSRRCSNTRNHTEETKNKISAKIRGLTNTNSYVRQSKITYDLICIECNNSFHSNKQIKFCSKSCNSKFSNRIRHKHIDKTTLKYYRSQCAFNFNLKDFPDEFNFSLIEEFGWYKAKNRGNNLNGISRDHIVSVKYGFKNNIDPKIISHPANCQLLRHNDNVSKNSKCDLSLEELLLKIEQWNIKYNLPK